jgi:hypothetical protein
MALTQINSMQISPALKFWTLILAPTGNQFVDWVAVKISYANPPGQHMAPSFPEAFNSIDLGFNFRWFMDGLVPIPTLSIWGMILMIGGFFLIAGIRRRRVL